MKSLSGTVDNTRKERDVGRFLDSIEPIQDQSPLSFRIDLLVIVCCKICIKIYKIRSLENLNKNFSANYCITTTEENETLNEGVLGRSHLFNSSIGIVILLRIDHIKGGSSFHA